LKIVLIDNDSLIRKMWEMAAKKAAVDLSTFKSVEDFIDVCDQYPIESQIYIDYELDDEKLGTIEAKLLFERGFADLSLATGHDPKDLDIPVYIKNVIGKRSPF